MLAPEAPAPVVDPMQWNELVSPFVPEPGEWSKPEGDFKANPFRPVLGPVSPVEGDKVFDPSLMRQFLESKKASHCSRARENERFGGITKSRPGPKQSKRMKEERH